MESSLPTEPGPGEFSDQVHSHRRCFLPLSSPLMMPALESLAQWPTPGHVPLQSATLSARPARLLSKAMSKPTATIAARAPVKRGPKLPVCPAVTGLPGRSPICHNKEGLIYSHPPASTSSQPHRRFQPQVCPQRAVGQPHRPIPGPSIGSRGTLRQRVSLPFKSSHTF